LLPATLEEATMATARKILSFVMLGLACIPAWGQAGKNAPATIPQVVDTPRMNTAGTDAVAQAVDPKSYLIGPEDILKIEVYREDQLSRIVNVRPDGKITLLRIGDVQAEGLTPERLQAQVKEAYSTLIINPEVTISVMQVNSQSFTITGRVNKAGRFSLVTPTRIFDALGLAGGFQEWAKQKDIQIIHANGSTSSFNYDDFLKRKKKAIDDNIFLQNGDAIVVK
jgi:polysaccharide export outer membrane protein